MKKHWTLIVPGAVLLCASPAFADRSAGGRPGRAQHQSRKSARRSTTRMPPQGTPPGRRAVVTRASRSKPRPASASCATRPAAASASPTTRCSRSKASDRRPAAVIDSGGRQAEIRRQAARTDAAAARIEERSEFVALNVSARLHRLSAAAAAGRDRAGQCDLPRAARRRPSRRRVARARSRSPTSSRPKSGCSRRAPG